MGASRPQSPAVRALALPQQAVDLLSAEHKKHPRNPYLFPPPKTRTMYDSDASRRTHDKILKAIGAEHIRFHDLRHTFVTLSLRSGVDVKTLSGTFRPFPRVGQVVSFEETAKIKHHKMSKGLHPPIIRNIITACTAARLLRFRMPLRFQAADLPALCPWAGRQRWRSCRVCHQLRDRAEY